MGHARDTKGRLSDNAPNASPGRRTWLGAIRARLTRHAPNPPQPPGEAVLDPPPINLILRTATPLIALMLRLPGLPPPANPEGLRHRIIAALRRFPSAARAAGITPDQMRAAHFILSVALDDIICQTAWGQRTLWPERNLTRTFHKSLEAGPILATLLNHILPAADSPGPNPHRDLLELVSVCLALGFDGRTQFGGAVDFQLLREEIRQALIADRGPPTAELSPSWQGIPAPRPPPGAALPVWVTVSLAGALLTGLYVLIAFSLGRDADRAYQQLATLLPDRPALIAHLEPPPHELPSKKSPSQESRSSAGIPAAAATATDGPDQGAAATPSARIQRLKDALAGEIAAGQLDVLTTQAGDVIRVSASIAFSRTGDTLTEPGHDLAEHLVAVLDSEPGHILVVGHTDDSFVPNLRFASSVALTEARARAFARVLVAHLTTPNRVDIEGRAGTEPLVPNTSPSNRDRNRRVDIILAPAEGRR